VVVSKEAYFNPTTPMGGAGGAGVGFLQDWVGKALLATGEAFSGSFAPGVNVVQKVVGGNAQGGAGGKGGNSTNTNVNVNPNTNVNNVNATSGSSSSSASSAGAAAASN
jgi:hypothetical protein